MADINLKWQTEEMQIHLEAFFPCAATKLKKLFKITEMVDFERQKQILNNIECYLIDAVAQYEAIKTSSGKDYWQVNQMVVDLTQAIKDKKKPNGVRYTKDELNAEKNHLKILKVQREKTKSTALDADRKLKAVQKNIELVKDYIQQNIN